jgi:LL-diaminopimelate aminotransferase
MITTAKRLESINEYYFSTKLQEIAALNKEEKSIINLGIGSPDLAPHSSVIERLTSTATDPYNHQYQSYRGIEALRKAMADWYAKYYNTPLDFNNEVLPLMGSKEGIMHLCMAYLNEGDEVLIPNPGYPTYQAAVTLAGGTAVSYQLEESLNWQPNFEALEQMNLQKVKMLFVNYPNMPTGANASMELYNKIIAFGKQHDILIVNDNPYSFILNEDPLSILAVDGAKEIAVELNSLSKSLNMAGWRVGMLCGNATVINNVVRFKSNMDSGMFLPIQLAAIKALALDGDWYTTLNTIYTKRKQLVVQIFEMLECTYAHQQQGLFMWAKVNANYKDGYALSDTLLYNHNVFITPGGIFGTAGNNYIRISLCQPEQVLVAALARIKSK